MTTADTQKAIMGSDEFVLEEVTKIQNIYRLKHEIRFAQDRILGDLTESVAEHTWGMHVVAHYFLTLENPEQTWNREQIFSMITWHDADEIIVGDIVSFDKLTNHSIDEHEVQKKVLASMPQVLQNTLPPVFEMYDKKDTPEARFVKAIDKIEGYIQMYQSGFAPILHSFGRSKEQSHIVIGKHVEEFPFVKRFYEVLDSALERDGYFIQSK